MKDAKPASIPVVRKHHALVRLAHWVTVPLLVLLVASGTAIHWAAPVFTHPRDPATGSTDYFADLGIAIARLFGHAGPVRGDAIYDWIGLGPGQLASALNLHWLLAYLFMLTGVVYVAGLALGGGWRALVPRRGDIAGALAMVRFYLGLVPMALLRRPWPHPPVHGKYNPLQKAAYFTVPLAGLLAVLSGWAMHQPSQLGWLERAFITYDGARIVHLGAMLVLASFVLPHVGLVIADGWDTFRSMVTGWSARVGAHASAPVEHADARRLRGAARRDFLLLAAGAAGALAGAWWLLPERTRRRLLPGTKGSRLDTLAARVGLTADRRRGTLDAVLTFDDDVAEALYAKDRRVRTYRRGDVTPLRVNMHGRVPDAAALASWKLELTGLRTGAPVQLSLEEIGARFRRREQGTRLVCVEGWSAVAWWGGFPFAELIAAYPPADGMRWIELRSALARDHQGRPDPYYVSLDRATAEHPQCWLVTHQDGRPLTPGHGAPLRLVAPMKLGLKNIKNVTSIAYLRDEPADYWNERGYSKYDGL